MTNTHSSPKTSPKEPKPSSGSNILFAIAVLVVIAGGGYLFLRPSSPSTPSAPTVTSSTTPVPAADEAAPGAQASTASAPQPIPTAPPKKRPPAGAPMPEIDFGEFSPARPADQVRSAHYFAAKYPDVAQYVPCFCGCGRLGHKSNRDCYIKAFNANGTLTFTSHAAT